jgi:hypothetical protein
MPVPFNNFVWSYPPRGDTRIPYKDTGVIRMWKRYDDAIAQYKMNGTNDQVVVFPDGKIEHWPRHKYLPGTRKPDANGVPYKMDYELPKHMREEILDLTPRGKFTIYNAELLHHKTTMVKNTLYFFDVLVWDGQHLLEVEYRERYAILPRLFGSRNFSLDLPKVDGKIFVAENLKPSEWDDAWKRLQPSPYTEGLVLKRLGAVSRLQRGDREKNNGGFLCRCRKANKNLLY